jgi:hypothetical protein
MPGHNSSANPSPTGGPGHNDTPPHSVSSSSSPGQQSGPGIPNSPPPLPTYPGHYPLYPYPQPGPGYPYLPPVPVSGPSVPPPFQVLPPIIVPPPQQRSSLKPLWITLAVVLALLIVICITCTVIFSLSIAHIASQTAQSTQVAPALEPVLAAQNFCDYEMNQDYSSAYQQLSTRLQSEVSRQQFESDNQTRDTTLGQLVGCSAARLSPATGDQGTPQSPSTLSLDIWLGGLTTSAAPPHSRSGTITMVEEGLGWKVDVVDSALQLI